MGGRGNFKGDPKSIEPFLTIGKSMFFGEKKDFEGCRKHVCLANV